LGLWLGSCLPVVISLRWAPVSQLPLAHEIRCYTLELMNRSILLPLLIAGLPCFGMAQADQGSASSGAEWRRSTEENPLYGKSFDRFVLTGRYFTRPSAEEGPPPKITVGCVKGKFASGELFLGAVAQHSGTRSFKGVSQAQLDMRIDEKKKTERWLEISNNGKTLFFDKEQLIELLTGRLLGHPSDPASLTHRLVFGIVEAFANEVIVQFDMPPDSSELVHSCGLEWGKKK
jgi:hypothetical protein